MDATPCSESTEPVVDMRLDGSQAPEKRPIENGGGDELGERSSKKAKVGDGGGLKRVAEIVLVLSTMAAMRGGRKPTDVENELMMEARAKLAELCQELAPKDIVAREAIGTVIEDMGLNGKIKDQRLGFRTPKMSVAERFSHARRKMEESKKFSAHSATYPPQSLQTSTGGIVENRQPSHSVRMLPSDKSNHAGLSSASTLSSTHVPQVSPALHHPSSSDEVRPPTVTSGMSSSHWGRNSSSLALPKVEQPQFKVDGGSNGSYVLQVQANSSANQPNAPTWSIQTQSASSTRNGPENKVPGHISVKVEGMGDHTLSRAAPQPPRDQSFRPFITQTTPGNLSSVQQPLQGANIVQPPLFTNNHNEIAKIVQKFLRPKFPEHPTWTPPSRDYMSKATTCQMCNLTVIEVDTVLLCDACEKGFHLKCLQSSVLRGIPRGEWHCMRCLTLSNGKPLPPKYGRVMRSSNTPNTQPKVLFSTGGIQPSSEKKAEVLDTKGSHQKLTTNGSSASTKAFGNSSTELPSDSKTLDTREMQGDSITSSTKHMDEKPDPSISKNTLDATSNSSVGLLGEISAQQIKNSEASTCKEGQIASEIDKLSEQNLQVEQTVMQDNDEGPLDKHIGNSLTYNNQKESLGEGLRYDIQRDDKDVTLGNSGGISGTNTEARQHSQLPSNGSHVVEWIGDVIRLVNEKKFYQSCCVDGVTYRLQDHALFISSLGKLEPSKLQSMWEDSTTGLKSVNVTKCYFPGDLPGNIAHPCISEVNEVYESNSGRTEMAASIRGRCEVLPSDKFKQETDRQNQLGHEASARLQPIFLCRWFYDEVKKLFQPVTS